ncbi:putative nucleotide sugar dehydrogenase [Natrialba magadii ATCC 43099]|uniref:UDP-N-acetyl-D-mannosamine dehydrogenase n=1 Tax=Natrialba magadii (strain ATCC 43099 / DSM 3394 / CCM 3739 / CIP 104546 / IAM 13178 / JCM 8861 / NBRC 102185 / NCIMB 2190 / MS3) TaxID=547559 RepID=D3SR10_NATMM|nr:nucleotide sugar dehydrogenase [Natrialba magadii]ADD06566.1 putative nucleotide sugar dehydrogenase [Natrialba magadii ATCC 43099]ELY31973.1 nucleotide sugar dehydrogenase [Natrialba magadii ATCC 43099]
MRANDAPTAESHAPPVYGTDLDETDQHAALTGGDVPVAVYGLGKMGLPLAAVYAETTGNVTGVDVDPDVVETINAGESHVIGEPGLADLVAEQVEQGRFEATTDGSAAAAQARIHVIIVPTLLDEDNEPDLTTIESVAADIAAGLSPGDLVIAESTLPPGTCRDVLQPFLATESGLDTDEFGLAFCPERTSSGRALQDIRGAYPKVVGGVDDESTRAATVLYDELSDNEVHPVADATTAEAVKVFEGIYRDVNIGLANELGRLADELNISVREAIETANDLPMCQLHDPGPGVGGHCIPYYPHFLLSRMDEPMDLTRTARRVNHTMPSVVVDRLESELVATGIETETETETEAGAGTETETDLADASVAVLGITYRPGVEETRASPAIGVIERLHEHGASVLGVDPLVDPAEYGTQPCSIDAFESASVDAAVVVTPHEEFNDIDWDALDPTVVIDGRDALDRGVLESAGHRVYTLAGSADGRPPAAGTGAFTTDDTGSRNASSEEHDGRTEAVIETVEGDDDGKDDQTTDAAVNRTDGGTDVQR